MKTEIILSKRVKNELHGIRQRIDKEKNPAKKAEMIKVYRKMSKMLL